MKFEKKIVILPLLIVSIALLGAIKRIKIARLNRNAGELVKNEVLYIAIAGWLCLFLMLIIKYEGIMRFSNLDVIYEQRELTRDVGGLWGYAQLYFTVVFSTLLIAYGLTSARWLWFYLGTGGYFTMYLITAEKSHLIYPLFFLAVNYLIKSKRDPIELFSGFIAVVSAIIFGIIFFSEKIAIFDFLGFYLFTRLIATPSQFILDYYDFFSTNGYTFFSQIRGFDLLIDAPAIYASNPKWPQLGWIVGAGMHGIQSNSNATFFASDGAASLGGAGMFLMTIVLCIYLVVINSLSRKLPKLFWSIVFAQQAFVLVSGSLFSMLLSFGGLFYLTLFWVYRPRNSAKSEVT